MASIQLYKDCPQTDTIVPNIFIDNFMPEANGEFVKVYLYLLRSMSSHACDISISAIADCFNHTEKDVIRALKYWERTGLIKLDYASDKSICGIHFLNAAPTQENFAAPARNTATDNGAASSARSSVLAEETLPKPAAADIREASTPVGGSCESESKPRAKREYTLDEMKVFQSSPEITELIFVMESYLKRTLTSTDLNAIFYWYDELHFSCELIDYLVQYCMSKGHSSARYMDKVAIGWHESGIRTVEDAKANAAIHSQAYYGVMKAFGITGRSLIENEKNFIKSWTKEYMFDLPIIQEACARTISATHQPSFEYADKILKNWYDNHVHTLDDIRKLDEVHASKKKSNNTPVVAVKKNKFTNFNQRDYDFDELETMLLNTNAQ